MTSRMESSIDSNSSANSNNVYHEVYEDFRRQALDFYGSEQNQKLLSTDVEKCLKKKASAFINREQKKLFLFPCMNDLSNIPDDDDEPSIPQKCLDSLLGSKFQISLSRRSSDAESNQSTEIKDFSSVMQKQALYKKNQEQY